MPSQVASNNNLSITEILLAMNNGGTVEALQTAIRETVEAVQNSGGAGSVTLKLTIKKNGEDAVTVTDAITNTKPKLKSPDSFFFVTENGLSRSNPRQMSLLSEANS